MWYRVARTVLRAEAKDDKLMEATELRGNTSGPTHRQRVGPRRVRACSLLSVATAMYVITDRPCGKTNREGNTYL
jgi:hypothetical protein